MTAEFVDHLMTIIDTGHRLSYYDIYHNRRPHGGGKAWLDATDIQPTEKRINGRPFYSMSTLKLHDDEDDETIICTREHVKMCIEILVGRNILMEYGIDGVNHRAPI